MSNTPFLLSDNLFENVVLHPTYVKQVSAAPRGIGSTHVGIQSLRGRKNATGISRGLASSIEAEVLEHLIEIHSPAFHFAEFFTCARGEEIARPTLYVFQIAADQKHYVLTILGAVATFVVACQASGGPYERIVEAMAGRAVFGERVAFVVSCELEPNAARQH